MNRKPMKRQKIKTADQVSEGNKSYTRNLARGHLNYILAMHKLLSALVPIV